MQYLCLFLVLLGGGRNIVYLKGVTIRHGFGRRFFGDRNYTYSPLKVQFWVRYQF